MHHHFCGGVFCSQVLYHYTDLPSAKAIVGGRQGLRLSRGGYKGGGVFFSTRAPVETLDPAESNRWAHYPPSVVRCGVGLSGAFGKL